MQGDKLFKLIMESRLTKKKPKMTIEEFFNQLRLEQAEKWLTLLIV
jgi:hypothetical protein